MDHQPFCPSRKHYWLVEHAYLDVERRESCRDESGQSAAENLSHHGLGHAEKTDPAAGHAEERRRKGVELRCLHCHRRVHVVLHSIIRSMCITTTGREKRDNTCWCTDTAVSATSSSAGGTKRSTKKTELQRRPVHPGIISSEETPTY